VPGKGAKVTRRAEITVWLQQAQKDAIGGER
jgi:hypothetical protein